MQGVLILIQAFLTLKFLKMTSDFPFKSFKMCSCQGTEMLRDAHTYRTASDGFQTRLSSWTRLQSAPCFDIQTIGIAQGKQRGFAQVYSDFEHILTG